MDMDKKEKCSSCIEATEDNNCCVDEVGEFVQRLVRIIQMFERDQIKPFGFTTTQCYVLLETLNATKLSMNELSEKMNLNTSTMTRIIDNLVRDQLIERMKADDDRRVVYINLTGKGYEAAKELKESVNNYYKKIIVNIPEGKIEDVLKSASILLDAFKKANPNCC